MNKTRIIFTVSILVIAIVIIAINIVIHQSEKEIISTPAQRITEVQSIEIQKEEVSSKGENTEELPPRIIPLGEELSN